MENRYIQIDDIFIGKNYKYVFDDLPDISSGDVNSQIGTFVNSDGAEYSNTTFEPRAFEIKGTILGDDLEDLKALKTDLIRACNPKNKKMIYYFDGFEKFRAMVFFNGNIDFSKRNGTTMAFVIYVVIPSFYWEKAETTVLPICQRHDEVTTTFTLPCVFTSKISQAEIENPLGINVYPKIKISINALPINAIPSATSIIIKNQTTGQDIILSGYSFSVGEEITIDCDNFTAYSNITDNLLNYLNDFEEWCIIPGTNFIKGLNNDTIINADIAVVFNEKRIGV